MQVDTAIGESGAGVRPVLLWVALTRSDNEASPPSGTEELCSIHITRSPDRIPELVRTHAPHLICFDYDLPTDAELALLRQTKRTLPSVPIVMLTLSRSESLVVWALRARVWDYVVKPCAAEDILRAVQAISRIDRERNDNQPGRQVIFPLHGYARASRPTRAARIVHRAQSYVMEHLSEQFQLSEVAQHCCVSQSHLSRIFRSSCGVSFTEFVLQTRIRKALELLKDLETSVTYVCYEVGFQDPSYFGRMFRRYVGMNPSLHRKMVLKNRLAATRQDRLREGSDAPRYYD